MGVRSKVAMLPEEVRTELERRIVEQAFSGYQDLAEWLQGQGYSIAHDSVQRHGSRLQQKMAAMERLAEQAKALTAAVAQTGGTFVDAAIELIHQRVFALLLDEPEQGEEASSTLTRPLPQRSGRGAQSAEDASHTADGGASLALRDLTQMTRIIVDLGRFNIARQQHAVKAKVRQEQQKTDERRAKGQGGLSKEEARDLRKRLLGTYYVPEPDEIANAVVAPFCSLDSAPSALPCPASHPHSRLCSQPSGRGTAISEQGALAKTQAGSHRDKEPCEGQSGQAQAHLDADGRSSTLKSDAPPDRASHAKDTSRGGS